MRLFLFKLCHFSDIMKFKFSLLSTLFLLNIYLFLLIIYFLDKFQKFVTITFAIFNICYMNIKRKHHFFQYIQKIPSMVYHIFRKSDMINAIIIILHFLNEKNYF